MGSFQPKVSNLQILDTGATSITLQASVNFSNPTNYTAHVPYINIHIMHNGSIIGEAIARDVNVVSGNNSDIIVEATWDPYGFGGKSGKEIGRELLSQYISGWNTTLTLKAHRESIPSQPGMGMALSRFELVIPTPKLAPQRGGDDHDSDGGDASGGPRFIEDATVRFHGNISVPTNMPLTEPSSICSLPQRLSLFFHHCNIVIYMSST